MTRRHALSLDQSEVVLTLSRFEVRSFPALPCVAYNVGSVGERLKVRYDPKGNGAVLADESPGDTAMLAAKVAMAMLIVACMWYWQSGAHC